MNNKKKNPGNVEEVFSTHRIAELLNVDISSVSNWINSGKLEAYRTPGGHRRVLKRDFIEFIKEYNMPVSNADKNRLKVLIVDDEEIVRQVVQRIVKRKYPDSIIFETSDGFTAGKLLAAEEITFLVLDIKMQGMNGFDVMKQIKNDPRLGSPDILVITGYPEDGLKENVKSLGARGLLIKPFGVEEFNDEMEKIIGH